MNSAVLTDEILDLAKLHVGINPLSSTGFANLHRFKKIPGDYE
jgi:hypothetical protein